jgi:hypothetical protein
MYAERHNLQETSWVYFSNDWGMNIRSSRIRRAMNEWREFRALSFSSIRLFQRPG